MKVKRSSKLLYFILFVLLLLGVFFILQKNRRAPAQGMGGQIYEKIQNPLEDKLPETNPFSVETNPVKKVYKNPFE